MIRKFKRQIACILINILILCNFITPISIFASDVNFKDVNNNDWFYDAVSYVYENNIMNGFSDNEFRPLENVSRAQMCQILYNLDDKKNYNIVSEFLDVHSTDWYYESVSWAAYNGIVNGIGDNMFAPKAHVTRQQIVSMLYRYADYKKYDINKSINLEKFIDYKLIANWAITAFKWAVAEGYIEGVTLTELSPDKIITRGQIAVLLKRFCEKNYTIDPEKENQTISSGIGSGGNTSSTDRLSKSEAYTEFEKLDVNDFNDYDIINLDESNETNYAVLLKDTISVKANNFENILEDIDYNDGIYKFSNVTDEISKLKNGNILYYNYGNNDKEYEIIKVDRVCVEGKNAEIIASSPEIEDVFEYIDIDMEIPISSDEVTSNNISDVNAIELMSDNQSGGSLKTSIKLGIKDENFEVMGNVSLTYKLKISYYAESWKLWKYKINEITSSLKRETSADIEIKMIGVNDKVKQELLPKIKTPIISGIDAELEAYGVISGKAGAKGVIKATSVNETGSKWVDGAKEEINKSDANIDTSINGDIDIKIGIGVKGNVVVLKVAKISLSCEGGVNINMKDEESIGDIMSDDGDEQHLCAICFDGTLSAYNKGECEVKVGVIGIDELERTLFQLTIFEKKIEITKFYVSVSKDNKVSFGLGICPNKKYRIDINLINSSNVPISNAIVKIKTKNDKPVDSATTDENGKAYKYLSDGDYIIYIEDLKDYIDKAVNISVKSKKVTITLTLENRNKDEETYNARYAVDIVGQATVKQIYDFMKKNGFDEFSYSMLEDRGVIEFIFNKDIAFDFYFYTPDNVIEKFNELATEENWETNGAYAGEYVDQRGLLYIENFYVYDMSLNETHSAIIDISENFKCDMSYNKIIETCKSNKYMYQESNRLDLISAKNVYQILIKYNEKIYLLFEWYIDDNQTFNNNVIDTKSESCTIVYDIYGVYDNYDFVDNNSI